MDHGVRDAMQDKKGPLYIATPYATRLDEIATPRFTRRPTIIARLGFAVAHALDPRRLRQEDFPLAGEIARALKAAKKPLVISGPSCAQRGHHSGSRQCGDGSGGAAQLYRARVQ